MVRVTRKYTSEFKRDCVNNYLLNISKGLKEVSKNLGIPYGTLRDWVGKYESENSTQIEISREENTDRIIKLELELIKVKEEREVLKKALAIFINN